MAEFPALPLWTDAWVADTAHLTRAERGLYHDLLVMCWRSPECRIPNDMDWVARRLRCSGDEIETLKAIVSEFLSSTGNWLFQKRLKKEFDYCRDKSQKQSVRAKGRWNKDNSISHGNAQNTVLCNAPTPTPTPIDTKEVDTSLDASASKAEVRDARTELFREGLDTLKTLSGKPDNGCRSLIARWLKDNRDDASEVLAVIRRAALARPVDVVPWIVAGLRGPPQTQWQRQVNGIQEAFDERRRQTDAAGPDGAIPRLSLAGEGRQ